MPKGLPETPFPDEAVQFIEDHETIYVIEQNRDGQMRKLLINECDISPKKLISVVNFDGLPITATHICQEIEQKIEAMSPSMEIVQQGGSKS